MTACQRLLLLGAFVPIACNPEPIPPNPPGTFAFAIFGDAPYGRIEQIKVGKLIRALNTADLQWVINLGDILWYPCSEQLFRARFELFQHIRHPFIYTPGDNEWADCHERIAGSYQPLDRLQSLRSIFFPDPSSSTGGATLDLVSQAADSIFNDFPENARWTHEGIVFATVHVVGSWNAGERFVGRSWQDDAARARRDSAGINWLRQAFQTAHEIEAKGVVIAMHADPSFDAPLDDPERMAYDGFLFELEKQVERFGRPVLLIHGDNHEFVVDKPLKRRTTGRVLENFTRLESFGSPDVGWVSVLVDTSSAALFGFQPHLVRLWF